jgi:hypothetical protein
MRGRHSVGCCKLSIPPRSRPCRSAPRICCWLSSSVGSHLAASIAGCRQRQIGLVVGRARTTCESSMPHTVDSRRSPTSGGSPAPRSSGPHRAPDEICCSSRMSSSGNRPCRRGDGSRSSSTPGSSPSCSPCPSCAATSRRPSRSECRHWARRPLLGKPTHPHRSNGASDKTASAHRPAPRRPRRAALGL